MRATITAIVLTTLAVGCANSTQATPQAEAPGAAATAEERPSTESLSVGDLAPAFENLIGVDDKLHALDEYADAKAIAIVFTCNHCPVAVAYEDRLNALHNDYAGEGLQILAINVNNMEADKLPAMKTRAEEKGFQFPYLYDPSQHIGRRYGATVTPHIFLLDGQRQLAFVGPVDDNMNEVNVTKQYLRDAIDAVLAGESPATSHVKPFGCGIQYE